MNETQNKFVASRAETLAREFLTRRPEVVLHPFGDHELDLVATLSPSTSLKVRGFSPFGVVVWGTDKSVSSEPAASSFATRLWKSDERADGGRAFYFPVLALLFAVKDDIGYYTWLSEPHFPDDEPKLIPNTKLDCTMIMRNSLDNVVQKVAEWYTKLAPVIISA